MHEVEYLESFAGPGSNFTENDKMEVKGGVNTFVNDGSFMEMFRKRMEEEKLRGKEDQSASEVKNGESPGSSGSQRPTGGASEVSSGLTPIDKESLLPEQTAITKTDSGIEQPCDDNLQTLSTQQSAEAIDSNPKIKHEKRKSKWEQKKAIEEAPTENSSNTTSTVTTAQKKYSLLSHVGKRKGGKLSLKTGTVKKQKTPENQQAQDPWSKYMAEVEKYKAHVCGDEDKSRPLVK